MFQEMAFIKKLIFLVMALFFCLFTGLSYAAAPQAVSLSPSSGTIRANKALNLTTVYTDADGRGNLHYAMFLVNRSVDGKDCFYGYYLVKENKLYLRNDANTAWVGGFAPGSANIIQNSYVSLNCAKTRISGTGIKLAIRWNVTFKNTFIGLKNCYLYAKDKSGNRTDWAKKGTWRIGTNTAPKVGTIAPDSGSAQPDTRVYFTTTFSDVDGYNDLQYGALLVNTSVNGAKCFYAYYLPGTNKLYLRNDANTAWLGGFAPKSNKAIRNSYAKLDCSKTTVSYSGTTLTIRWCVVFRSTFTGSKNCYLYAKDTAGARTAWEKKGTW
ncbi:MAG: hypothetical protein PHD09_06940, partial [Candidatus Omnitrophica bacterium]|nr:hypothetical protein [Candidatus Omnitrophota bacterium]